MSNLRIVEYLMEKKSGGLQGAKELNEILNSALCENGENDLWSRIKFSLHEEDDYFTVLFPVPLEMIFDNEIEKILSKIQRVIGFQEIYCLRNELSLSLSIQSYSLLHNAEVAVRNFATKLILKLKLKPPYKKEKVTMQNLLDFFISAREIDLNCGEEIINYDLASIIQKSLPLANIFSTYDSEWCSFSKKFKELKDLRNKVMHHNVITGKEFENIKNTSEFIIDLITKTAEKINEIVENHYEQLVSATMKFFSDDGDLQNIKEKAEAGNTVCAFNLANHYYSINNIREAGRYFSNVEKDPIMMAKPEVLLLKAKIVIYDHENYDELSDGLNDDFEEALVCLDMIDLNGLDISMRVEIVLFKSNIYSRLERLDDAFNILNETVRKLDKSTRYYHEISLSLGRLSRRRARDQDDTNKESFLHEALGWFEDASDSTSCEISFEALFEIGDIYFELENLTEAKDRFQLWLELYNQPGVKSITLKIQKNNVELLLGIINKYFFDIEDEFQKQKEYFEKADAHFKQVLKDGEEISVTNYRGAKTNRADLLYSMAVYDPDESHLNQAKQLYQELAEPKMKSDGNPDSQFWLARYYLEAGYEDKQNLKLAINWLVKAGNQGHKESREELLNIYRYYKEKYIMSHDIFDWYHAKTCADHMTEWNKDINRDFSFIQPPN